MSPPLVVYGAGEGDSMWSMLRELPQDQPVVVLVGTREAVAAAARLMYQQVELAPAGGSADAYLAELAARAPARATGDRLAHDEFADEECPDCGRTGGSHAPSCDWYEDDR